MSEATDARDAIEASCVRVFEVDLILSSRRARERGSVSVVKRDLSSERSLWAVECGLMVSRFVELARGEVGREARVEDLLVLLPSEIFDFVVATTGVPVSGDSAWVLEFG